MNHSESFAAVKWDAGKLILLDQRCLPNEVKYEELVTARETADAIRNMIVRGAPAIGITAAYGVVLAARHAFQKNPMKWKEEIEADIHNLSLARPTAVNLVWAIAEMRKLFESIEGDPEPALLELAIEIHEKDIAANYEMGRLGSELIPPNTQVMTHCNAGALATGGYGTALGVIRSAHNDGLIKRVYASETRPWLQGARLTSWELQQDNIPVHLVIDSAVSSLMSSGAINWLIVGADRIAANGDVANKIGTYSHAVSAKHHDVKVMVVAPSSTVDMAIESGEKIPIENRTPEEITDIKSIRVAPENVNAINPAFDITPSNLIDFIVTEKGIIEHPDSKKMLAIFSK